MNWKSFAAGVVCGAGTAYGVGAVLYWKVKKEADNFLSNPEEIEELLNSGDPVSVPLGDEDEEDDEEFRSPSDVLDEMMESFDTDTPAGSSIQAGSPEDGPLGGLFDGMNPEDIQEHGKKVNENQVKGSLQDGPKDWDELKDAVFGPAAQFAPEEAINQELDSVLTRLRQQGAIVQRDDNLYELSD